MWRIAKSQLKWLGANYAHTKECAGGVGSGTFGENVFGEFWGEVLARVSS